MHRITRTAALTAVIAAFPLLAACSAAGTAVRATPSPTTAGKGQVITNTGPAPAAANRSKCAPGSQTEPLVTFGGLKMTSPTSGWALGQCTLGAQPTFPNGSTIQCYWPDPEFAGILRTDDGGRTWTDVSPPSVANRSFQHAEFFLDAQHAWVGEVSRTADACVSAVTTFMTSDGGKTWRQGGTIAVKSESPTSGLFDVPGPTHSMDFIDQQRGWMLLDATAANPQPGAMVDPTLLYSTTDGGLHWTLVATNPGRSSQGGGAGCPSPIYAPASDAVFTDSTSGWLAIQCPPGMLVLKTQDGGHTWASKPLPCSCQVWLASYLDANHAVITGMQGSPVLVATGDGGATWAQRAVPKAALTLFSFIDPARGWMVGIEQLPTSYDTVVYGTTDGGQSWSLLGKPGFATPAASSNAYFYIQTVQFVDANTGFVLLGQENGAQGAGDQAAPQVQLLATGDGGRSWSVVYQQAPAAAACGLGYHQIGFANGRLWPAKMASPRVGWGKGGLRTTDGGAHWRDVSPPALREGSTTPLYPPGYTDFYLDGDHAWQAAVYGSKSSCADHVTTFATADGGKTWQQSVPIALSLAAGDQTGRVQIGFTSIEAGWLLVPIGARTADPFDIAITAADLYVTSDGGATWRHVSTLSPSHLPALPAPSGSEGCKPGFGDMEFSSASVGWLSFFNCGNNAILVTRDGGITWKVQDFAIPTSAGCPCYLQLPTFADENHGVVVVGSQGGLTAPAVLLTTADGGQTWHESARPGDGYVLLLSFVNASDVFALVTPPGWTKGSNIGFELYRSANGGGNWVLVQKAVPATWPPGFLQFVDVNHGFESNINGADVLLKTDDGGKSWTAIMPAVG